MKPLEYLIKALLKRQDTEGCWQISRDEILEILDLDIRDVYVQIIRSENPLVDFGTSEFSEKDSGALISLLECLGYEKAPDIFSKMGLWIPYSIQVDLLAALIDEITSARNSHTIEFENFLSIFDRFGNFQRSLEIYLEEHFSLPDYIGGAVNTVLSLNFREKRDNHRLLLTRLANELVRREIVPYWNLFSPLYEELKAYLIAKGRMDAPGNAKPAIDKAQSEARRLFSYSKDEAIAKKELKDRYKKLMKRYHPDVNPQGLEKSKEINRAYSLLLARIA